MARKIISIWYAEDESGPAELLEGRLARIVDPVILGEGLWQNDIVRLTFSPEEKDGRPRIAEVVWSPFAKTSMLQFHHLEEAWLLRNILAMVGGDSRIVTEPKEERRGLMLVAHPEFVEPDLLADSLGIPQFEEEAAQEESSESADGEQDCTSE